MGAIEGSFIRIFPSAQEQRLADSPLCDVGNGDEDLSIRGEQPVETPQDGSRVFEVFENVAADDLVERAREVPELLGVGGRSAGDMLVVSCGRLAGGRTDVDTGPPEVWAGMAQEPDSTAHVEDPRPVEAVKNPAPQESRTGLVRVVVRTAHGPYQSSHFWATGSPRHGTPNGGRGARAPATARRADRVKR